MSNMPRHATSGSYGKGDTHPKWKGGTHDYRHREARNLVNAPKGKIVHHIDGNWKNNDISNLQIMTQSEHVALHNKSRIGIPRLTSLMYILNEKISELTLKGWSSRKIAKYLNIGKTTVLRSRKLNEVKKNE